MDILALAVMASAALFSGFVVLVGWRWDFVSGLRPAAGPAQE